MYDIYALLCKFQNRMCANMSWNPFGWNSRTFFTDANFAIKKMDDRKWNSKVERQNRPDKSRKMFLKYGSFRILAFDKMWEKSNWKLQRSRCRPLPIPALPSEWDEEERPSYLTMEEWRQEKTSNQISLIKYFFFGLGFILRSRWRHVIWVYNCSFETFLSFASLNVCRKIIFQSKDQSFQIKIRLDFKYTVLKMYISNIY